METINISKTLNFTKGSIEVRYSGIPNDNVNLDKIDALLEDFMHNHRHNNMIENVSIIRTIFKDCEEKLLNIFYQDEKGSELVQYDNYNLFLYQRSKREENSEHFDRYKVKYEPISGIKLDYNNHATNVADYPGIELVSEEITEMMQQIYNLKNVQAIVLDKEDKAIIEIYRLFYNENPDFSSKDINIKVQTMVFILAHFGIFLEEEFRFSLCGKEKTPLSMKLQQKVDKLYPLGLVSNDDDSIKIDETRKITIKFVGESIRETISDEQTQNEVLITISKVINAWIHNFCNPDIKMIAKCTELTPEEVESSIKLVKQIQNRIDTLKNYSEKNIKEDATKKLEYSDDEFHEMYEKTKGFSETSDEVDPSLIQFMSEEDRPNVLKKQNKPSK